MKQFDNIRLTVVDFFGVFLPGSVWTILFLTVDKMMDINNHQSLITPVSVAISYANKDYNTAFYAGLSMASLFFGYINMAVSTIPAQFISNFFPNILLYISRLKKHRLKVYLSRRSFRRITQVNEFPYGLKFRMVDSTPKCNPSAHAASCNVSAKNTV